MKRKGRRIRTLEQLSIAAKNRRSVIYSGSYGREERQPAAWVINNPGCVILWKLQRGMFLYNAKNPISPDAPVRGGRKPKPIKPAPILNLPYHPETP